MKESDRLLDEMWQKMEIAKKEYSRIIVSGLSDTDFKEVNYACQIIKNELIPALELDADESKKSSLKTLNILISERRPPKDQNELSDIENAAFFKLLKDIQNSSEKNNSKEGSFLHNSKTSLLQLQNQYKGKKFGELVLHHINEQDISQINAAIRGIRTKIKPELIETTDKFLETIIYGFATIKDFWRTDCGEALMLYANSTKSEAKKFGITVDDDYAFDIFNLIILSLAKQAYSDDDFRKFIKKSVRLFGLF